MATPAPTALTRQLSTTLTTLDPRQLLPIPRRQLPPADSLIFYAALAVIGIAELIEWPAILVAATAPSARRPSPQHHRDPTPPPGSVINRTGLSDQGTVTVHTGGAAR